MKWKAILVFLTVLLVAGLTLIVWRCRETVKVEIKIVAKATTDTYTRYHGKSIDAPLPIDFYKDKEASPYYIGLAKGSFEHTQTVDLAPGTHTIRYEPGSTAEGYYWEAEVFVNGQSLGKQSDLWIGKQYEATFEVKAGLAEMIGALMPTVVGLMMLVLVISLISGIMKALRKK